VKLTEESAVVSAASVLAAVVARVCAVMMPAVTGEHARTTTTAMTVAALTAALTAT